jgi:Fructose-2,6-bisphosphatase
MKNASLSVGVAQVLLTGRYMLYRSTKLWTHKEEYKGEFILYKNAGGHSEYAVQQKYLGKLMELCTKINFDIDTMKNSQDSYIAKEKLPPTIDERLLEQRMGDFENRSRKELHKEFPACFSNIGGRGCFRFALTPPNGEAYSEFAERVSSFCEEIMSATEEKNILICSHNQAMKMMHFILKGIQPTEEAWYKISFPNGEIVSLI